MLIFQKFRNNYGFRYCQILKKLRKGALFKISSLLYQEDLRRRKVQWQILSSHFLIQLYKIQWILMKKISLRKHHFIQIFFQFQFIIQ